MNMTEKFEWGSKSFANVSKFLHVFYTTVSLSVQNSFIFIIFEVFFA